MLHLIAVRIYRQTQRGRHHVRQKSLIRHDSKIDEKHPTGRTLSPPAADFDRQPRLAASAHTGERDQTSPADQSLDLGQFGVSAHEAGQLLRQIVIHRPTTLGGCGTLCLEGF